MFTHLALYQQQMQRSNMRGIKESRGALVSVLNRTIKISKCILVYEPRNLGPKGSMPE